MLSPQKPTVSVFTPSRIQPSSSFVDVILSFCRRLWWDIALHGIAMHRITI